MKNIFSSNLSTNNDKLKFYNLNNNIVIEDGLSFSLGLVLGTLAYHYFTMPATAHIHSEDQKLYFKNSYDSFDFFKNAVISPAVLHLITYFSETTSNADVRWGIKVTNNLSLTKGIELGYACGSILNIIGLTTYKSFVQPHKPLVDYSDYQIQLIIASVAHCVYSLNNFLYYSQYSVNEDTRLELADLKAQYQQLIADNFDFDMLELGTSQVDNNLFTN